MSDIDTYDEKRRYLKQKLLSRAISEGRGGEAIRKLNTLYRNVQATLQGSDDDVISNLSASLTEGRARATLGDLQKAAFEGAGNKYLRAFNMERALLGMPDRLSETNVVPGTTTLQ